MISKIFSIIYFILILHSSSLCQTNTDSVYTYQFKSPNDSILVEKTYNYYDKWNNLILKNSYAIDQENKSWMIINKSEYEYNSQNLQTRFTYYIWNNQLKKLELFSNEENDYDNHGRSTIKILDVFGSKTKSEISYDEYNNITSISNYGWNYTSNTWIMQNKIIKVFNSKKQELSRIEFNGENNSWINSNKSDFFLNTEGNINLVINYQWDKSKSIWIYRNKTEYSYSGENIQFTLFSSWDNTLDQWIKFSQSDYTYDYNKKLTALTVYGWDLVEKKWVINARSVKYTYEYDKNGNVILEIYYKWNTDQGMLLPYGKIENEINDKGKYLLYSNYSWDVKNKIWIGIPLKKVTTYPNNNDDFIEISFNWDSKLNNWINYYKVEYYFNEDKTVKFYETYAWNKNTNEWVGNSKQSYSKNDLINSVYIYNWDNIKKTWVNNKLNKSIFDSDAKTLKIESFEVYINNKYEFDKKKYHYFLSSNANLASLIIENGKLNIPFSKTSDEYSATANYDFKIIATPEDKLATIKIIGPKDIKSNSSDDRVAIITVESPNKKIVKSFKIIFEMLALSVSPIQEIEVYPNPVSDFLIIPKMQDLKVIILNSTGQQVYPKIETFGDSLKINFSEINSGIYTLIINSENGILSKKIVKI